MFALEEKNGEVKWERAAMGRIGDIYLVHDNIALIIDSTETSRTRIAE